MRDVGVVIVVVFLVDFDVDVDDVMGAAAFPWCFRDDAAAAVAVDAATAAFLLILSHPFGTCLSFSFAFWDSVPGILMVIADGNAKLLLLWRLSADTIKQ